MVIQLTCGGYHGDLESSKWPFLAELAFLSWEGRGFRSEIE